MPSVVQIWIGVGSFKYKLYNAVASREQVSGSSQVTKGRGAGRVVILNSKLHFIHSYLCIEIKAAENCIICL